LFLAARKIVWLCEVSDESNGTFSAVRERLLLSPYSSASVSVISCSTPQHSRLHLVIMIQTSCIISGAVRATLYKPKLKKICWTSFPYEYFWRLHGWYLAVVWAGAWVCPLISV
jgi:hypothetical protein